MTRDVKIIEPVAFRPGKKGPRGRRTLPLKWLMPALVAGGLLLSIAVWFVFTASQIEVLITPEPDRIFIKGRLLRLRIDKAFLLRPGTYVVNAAKTGYHTLEAPFTVTRESGQKIRLTIEKLPGLLSLLVHEAGRPDVALKGAAVTIDGQKVGQTPLQEKEIAPGVRQLRISAEGYQDHTQQLMVAGMGHLQELRLELVPIWAQIGIRSVPTGANVYINDAEKGLTPLDLRLDAGEYNLSISAAGYKTRQTRLTVQANQSRVLDPFTLQPADGKLALISKPAGAAVTIDKRFAGQTPIEVPLAPDKDHRLQLSKAGHAPVERIVNLTSGVQQTLTLKLEPRYGTIHFTVEPAGTSLIVDGKKQGSTPQSLRLVAVEHVLEIKKPGYQPYRKKITPRPGLPQELRISLKKTVTAKETAPGIITAVNGYRLKRIQPAAFNLGSSRREQGRRSNETLRPVELKKVFFMGLKEVTNREFRQFQTKHNSGSVKTYPLNRPELPAVQVSWDQAAQFCNWLSQKDKLPAVYVEQNGKMIARDPLPAGYRLPTEAEWEYCARFSDRRPALRYPWGAAFPPASKMLNIADRTAKDMLPTTLETYDDGYAVTAPPGSFSANELGLYDLGGNVAEWCHDYYKIYTASDTALPADPAGPRQGNHHLIRGSSWRHSSLSSLRAAYRDYSREKRDDLGFRICRYK